MNINPRLLVNKRGKLLHDVFVPRPLQEVEKKLVFDIDILELLMNANEAISRFHNTLQETDFYQHSYFFDYCLKKETVSSLEINGHPAALENLMITALGRADDDIVYRFYSLTKTATSNPAKLSSAYLKKLHSQMITEEARHPGQYRTGYNMLYSYYRHNRFNPPLDEEIESSMNSLEEYINQTNNTNYLIKAALIHYQFTTIHPFVDGNSRLARLLNMLYLKRNNPFGLYCFYLSYYILAHLNEYYQALTEVRTHGNYQGWVEYYLRAVNDVSNHMRNILEYSAELLTDNRIKIMESSFSNTIKNTLFSLVEYMVFNPLAPIKQLSSAVNRSFPAVSNSVKTLVRMQILEPSGHYERSRLYIYRQQLDILKK
ncbi:MAG: Fic family protein [Bacilli bacterium]|nr:Fic family protein [Bacilli bacterium]